MPVEQDKLRAALEMLLKGELDDVAYERGVDVQYTLKAELIDALVEDSWTETEFQELLDEVVKRELEDRTWRHYKVHLVTIDSLETGSRKDQIETRLANQPATFTADRAAVEEEGFEVEDSDDGLVEATYWTKTDGYSLDPLGQLRSKSAVYGTGFTIDLEEDRIDIKASLKAKAQGLVGALDNLGIEVKAVGLDDDTNKVANQAMEDFVEDLEAELNEVAEQSELGEFK